jgi:Flp pilus assembly protein TadB
MKEDVSAANVNRAYSLAATNVAIFTFTLIFLYPRFENGTINPFLFQTTLATLGVATFSLVFAALEYYRLSLGGRLTEAEQALHARRADRFWLLGYTVMFLAPSLVLFTVNLLAVASIWLALWLVYLLFVIRYFPKVETPRASH